MDEPDLQLAGRLAQGDESAFRRLYDTCADSLHHYLTVTLQSRDDADDALQETFKRLMQTRRKLRGVKKVWAYVTSSRLDARLKELRAAGDPICIADLEPDPIPADQNAAIPLRRIRDDAQALLTEVGDYLQSDNYQAGTPNDEEVARLEKAFGAYPDLIPAIQQALALKDCQRDFDYSLPPSQFLENSIDRCGDERAVARILALHASVLRSHGQWDEAATVSIQLLQLAKLYSENACMLTDYLVSLALRTMAVQEGYLALRSKAVSAQVRGQSDAALAFADPLPGYLDALKSERAFGIDSFESFPVQVLWGGVKLNYLDTLAEEIRLAPLPFADYKASPERAAAAASAGPAIRSRGHRTHPRRAPGPTSAGRPPEPARPRRPDTGRPEQTGPLRRCNDRSL